ncbi:hypothetical protein Y032_0197g1562 [Ancylostoma ceylanicum]|uniref:Uncharacterized protein n=1 Tax=Ancylostoma ceylanicum TaxID=53326 RepID=A0A016SPA7_9BILA|nr:hypothetical protein Y032_0197g1562 [Ancylostoma ceylanicum]
MLCIYVRQNPSHSKPPYTNIPLSKFDLLPASNHTIIHSVGQLINQQPLSSADQSRCCYRQQNPYSIRLLRRNATISAASEIPHNITTIQNITNANAKKYTGLYWRKEVANRLPEWKETTITSKGM